jgi:probable rRNA maturation factor
MRVVIDLYDPEENTKQHILSQIAQETIDATDLIDDAVSSVTISVAIVSKDEIRRVNRKFRGKDVDTDVISVGDYSDDHRISDVRDAEVFLGEVILCYNYIADNAKENGIDVDREFFSVYIHGILHLMGFRHGDVMFSLQDRLSEKFYLQK